jgi:hypothetical protein
MKVHFTSRSINEARFYIKIKGLSMWIRNQSKQISHSGTNIFCTKVQKEAVIIFSKNPAVMKLDKRGIAIS